MSNDRPILSSGPLPDAPSAASRVREIASLLDSGEYGEDDLSGWVESLPELAPDHRVDYFTQIDFVHLCSELRRVVLGRVDLQLDLVGALEKVGEGAHWPGVVQREVTDMVNAVIDGDVIPELVRLLNTEQDQANAMLLYEMLVELDGMETDEVFYAVCAHPALDLERVVSDLSLLLVEELPDELLTRIQRSGREDLLDGLIPPYDANPVLGRLRDRAGYTEGVVARAERDGTLPPPWVFWETALLRRRPEIIRSMFPWLRVLDHLDGVLVDEAYAYVEERLGSDENHLETFRSLEGDFAGTLDDLITAAREL